MEEPSTPDAHSSKSAFHESDIEFLRASAREWLEAVLEESLDKETSLEDLLADGTLLYRASQHIKEDQKFPGHVDSPRHFAGPLSSSEKKEKSHLKYQPYASVESFLNVCKEVGLRDVDVFNPSDAVDKKDIRRVCVCLRRLSKKARTLHLLVPDFDNVKGTLVTPASKMPRDAVQKTKESLQKSASRPSPHSENGQVSSETSSSIADLRKDHFESVATDTKSADSEVDAEGESFNKEHHDVASERKGSVDTNSKYKVNIAEAGVDTLSLASNHTKVSQEHTETYNSKSNDVSKVTAEAPKLTPRAPKVSSEAPKASAEAPKVTTTTEAPKASTEASAALKPSMSRIMLKPPGGQAKGPVEEKAAKDTEEKPKGLFRAHLEGTAPYVEEVKKIADDVENGDSSWLVPVLGGAFSVAGGILGLVLWNKRSRMAGTKGFFPFRGKKKLARSTGIADSGSDNDEDRFFHSGGYYYVNDGDNLTKIARRTGRKHWSDIANKNPSIGNPDLIYPGDRLQFL